ncbi:uncharacterized protein, partial [Dysidea avara]|uniref:uncharacterized protein n=1 Tax=Dysidea avara TaxID=196820 RepID=UPI00332DE7D9
IKEIHDTLDVKFEGSLKFKDSHNLEVCQLIKEQVESDQEAAGTSSSKPIYTDHLISRALYRYWESRRRTFNDSQPDRAEAVDQNKKNSKRKSYQSRLYERRERALLTEKERSHWGSIDFRYMTEEETDDEGETEETTTILLTSTTS